MAGTGGRPARTKSEALCGRCPWRVCLYAPTLDILHNMGHDSPVLSIPFSSPRFRAAFTAHTRPESPSRISFLLLSMSRRPLPPTIPYVRRRCAALRLSLLARRSSCPANGGQPHAPGLSAPFSTLPLPLVHSGIRIPLNGWFPCRRCGCAFSLWRAANGVSGLFCGAGRAFGAHGHRKSAKPFCPDALVWFAFRCTIRPVWPKNVRVRGWRRTVAGRTNSGAPFPYTMSRRSRSAPGE